MERFALIIIDHRVKKLISILNNCYVIFTECQNK